MRTLISAALLAFTLAAAATEPVAWKLEEAPAKPVKAGARFTVKVVAKIEEGWHVYSMKAIEDGPVATRVWLAEGQPFQSAGPVKADPPQVVQDKTLNMEVELYEGSAGFAVPVRIAPGAAPGTQQLVVNATYQSCNNRLCLPPKTVKVEAAVTIGK
ncbi:MAG TPA: protein-disulfide reductase DsbD N-terminal domain-containing protein [Bryobacteraceae bacterium]|nr:protein-disulfide reductase DsbD N-terminal domain-containing protein [Bryobacteraceae bacterium]